MIVLQHVTKQFKSGRGIFDLTFEIQTGEVFGYLGPNGAGKSTTIRALMGFSPPDTGFASINGIDCWQRAAQVQENVGYLPGEISFLEGLTVMGFFRFLGSLRHLSDTARRDELIEYFDLDVKTPIRKMSKGMKQKVGIIAAFMHEPAVLILDEPTSGLDPLMQKRFLDLIKQEKERGATILMSSHLFIEIERVCDRVGIIKDGRLIAIEDIKVLQSLSRKIFTVSLANEKEVSYVEQAGCNIIARRGEEFDVLVQGNYDNLIGALSHCHVRNITDHELGLEQLFMHYYKE